MAAPFVIRTYGGVNGSGYEIQSTEGHWQSNRVRDCLADKLGVTSKYLDRIWNTAA